MRQQDIAYKEQAYDDSVCFKCGKQLKGKSFFVFNGFCDAKCAADTIIQDITLRPDTMPHITPQFLLETLQAIKEENKTLKENALSVSENLAALSIQSNETIKRFSKANQKLLMSFNHGR